MIINVFGHFTEKILKKISVINKIYIYIFYYIFIFYNLGAKK